MLKKICTSCEIEKPISEFNKQSAGKHGVRSVCSKCRNSNPKRKAEKQRYREKNRALLKQKSKEYYHQNKIAAKKTIRDYSLSHKKEKKEYDEKYRKKNAEKLKSQKRQWQNKKQKTDQHFILKRRLQTRIRLALKDKDTGKRIRTIELLGCSISEFKIHIESQFSDGMSFENMDKWHIDHKKPCALFDLTDPDQQRECFHYSNLQPLWAIDNLKKGCSYGSL